MQRKDAVEKSTIELGPQVLLLLAELHGAPKDARIIKLFRDGDKFCALLGSDVMEGDAGFGDTSADALRELAAVLEGDVQVALTSKRELLSAIDHAHKQGANATQVGGAHYKADRIEHWDFVIENGIPYLEAQIIKYVMRWRKKNGLQDLDKALHFLQKLKETALEEPRKAAAPA